MFKKDKISRHHTKTPLTSSYKGFDSHAFKAIKIAQRRKWTFIFVLAAITTVVIVFLVYHTIQSARETTINNEFAQIEALFNQENLAYQLKSNAQPKSTLSTPSDEPNNAISMKQFSQFALLHSSHPLGWQAGVRASGYFIAHGQLEKAKKILEALLPETYQNDILHIKVRTSLAGIYVNENNIPKALEQLNVIEKLPHNPDPLQTLLLKAQILVAAQNKIEAAKVLNDIIASPAASGSVGVSEKNETVHQAKILLNKIGFN